MRLACLASHAVGYHGSSWFSSAACWRRCEAAIISQARHERIPLRRSQMRPANRRVALGAVTGAFLAACHPRDNAGPTIQFTRIPQADPGGNEKNDIIEGIVKGGRSGQRIVLYARSGKWWVQPLRINPFTRVQATGKWTNATHLGTQYAALLVDPGFRPPVTYDALPARGATSRRLPSPAGKRNRRPSRFLSADTNGAFGTSRALAADGISIRRPTSGPTTVAPCTCVSRKRTTTGFVRSEPHPQPRIWNLTGLWSAIRPIWSRLRFSRCSPGIMPEGSKAIGKWISRPAGGEAHPTAMRNTWYSRTTLRPTLSVSTCRPRR